MTKKVILLVLLVTVGYSCDDKAKILIIGDSISMGYTTYLDEMLQDSYEVHHNPGNAKHTGFGIVNLDQWVKRTEDWDRIYFNWGLWDFCHKRDSLGILINDKKGGLKFSEPLEYKSNLEGIIQKLKKRSTADLTFVSTTFVPENEACRNQDEAMKYDSIARSVMHEYGIRILNITKESEAIHKTLGKHPNDVHYKANGYKKLAEIIAQDIRNSETTKMN